MIIVDRALQARAAAGNPVKVGMIGAGFMGRGITNQIINSVPGMELVAISKRNLNAAKRALTMFKLSRLSLIWKLPSLVANMPSQTMPCCCAKQKALTR